MKNKIRKIRNAGLVFLSSGSVFAGDAIRAPEQPNLLLIYTDDQRWDAIGYTTPFAHTPNIDRLSQEGIRFNQAAIVLPVCSPSRAAVLTGRYGMANGQTAFGSTSIHSSEVPFVKYLREAGYLTAQVGKWHIYGRDPLNFEFDEVRNAENTKDFWQPKIINNGVVERAPGTAHDYVVDQTIAIIRKANEQKKPFAIYLATLEPHNKMFVGGGSEKMRDETRQYYETHPLNTMPVPPNIYDDLSGKPPYLKSYRGRVQRTGKNGEKPMTPKRYWDCQYASFTMMTEVDRALGRLFTELEALDLRKNTYILFMGDNGLFQGEHGLMSKALHYEESVRVPFFAVGPGIAPGVDNQSLAANIDIAPTLLDLAGLPVPENMHGTSLKPALMERIPLNREYVLLEHPDVNPELETRTAFGLRSSRWKYIRTYEDGQDKPYTFEELYDLEKDPFELKNVINSPENKALLNQLRAELDAQRGRYHTNKKSVDKLVEFNFKDKNSIAEASVRHPQISAEFGTGKGVEKYANSALAQTTRSILFDNSGFNQTDESGAVSANDYVQFTLSADEGKQMTFSYFTIYTLRRDLNKEGLGAPDRFAVYTSADNFSLPVGGGTIELTPGDARDFARHTVDLTNVPALQALTGKVEFRIYFWASQGFGAPAERKFRIDDLAVGGAVTETK